MNEHGYCPNCGKDFDDTLIWDSFFDKYGDVDKADEAAASYGATREHGRWGLKIGIYSMDEDRTTHWKCPDCDHERERECVTNSQMQRWKNSVPRNKQSKKN